MKGHHHRCCQFFIMLVFEKLFNFHATEFLQNWGENWAKIPSCLFYSRAATPATVLILRKYTTLESSRATNIQTQKCYYFQNQQQKVFFFICRIFKNVCTKKAHLFSQLLALCSSMNYEFDQVVVHAFVFQNALLLVPAEFLCLAK